MKIKMPENYKIIIDGGYLQFSGNIQQENGVIKVDKIVYSDEMKIKTENFKSIGLTKRYAKDKLKEKK